MKKQLSMISEENKGDWKAERDIRSFPTNAFGKLEFLKEGLGGKKPSKVNLKNNFTRTRANKDMLPCFSVETNCKIFH